MDCHEAQEEILESFERVAPAGVSAFVETHLSECAACARFARIQQALDRRLGATLLPPPIGPGFRAGLHRRLHDQAASSRPDTLFERVHFASFAFATLVLSAYLPFDPRLVLSVGAAAALSSYVVFAAVRDVFERDPLQGHA